MESNISMLRLVNNLRSKSFCDGGRIERSEEKLCGYCLYRITNSYIFIPIYLFWKLIVLWENLEILNKTWLHLKSNFTESFRQHKLSVWHHTGKRFTVASGLIPHKWLSIQVWHCTRGFLLTVVTVYLTFSWVITFLVLKLTVEIDQISQNHCVSFRFISQLYFQSSHWYFVIC